MFPVEATLTKADAAIKPGMTADVRIHIEKKEHVLALPIEAVVKENGKQFVSKVVADAEGQAEDGQDRGHRRLRATTARSRSSSGIKEGDKVLIKPASSAENEYKM